MCSNDSLSVTSNTRRIPWAERRGARGGGARGQEGEGRGYAEKKEMAKMRLGVVDTRTVRRRTRGEGGVKQ